MRPSLSRSFISVLRLVIILLALLRLDHEVRAEVNDTTWKGFSVTCTNEEMSNVSVSCHGIRLVRRIVQKLLEEAKRKRSLEILDGISLVEREDNGIEARGGRVLKGFGNAGSVMGFLESRELRIKLPSLLPANLEAAIERSLPSINQGRGHGGGGGGFGGGGGKKGDNGVMLMALMMGKMMAAMGFSTLGLMAMKALMVSSLALMLSLIVAAKKLASSKDDDGHHVVYAQEVSSHHRRRRRSLDRLYQPYRAYAILPTELTTSR